MGCLILNDTPVVSLLNGPKGTDWLKTAFKVDSLNTCNTLFIQLFVVKEEYKKRGLVDFLRTAFRTVEDVNHLLYLVPQSINLGSIH